MVHRNVTTLDELDTAKAAEKEELALQERLAQNLAEASDFFDTPFLDPEALQNLPESFWAGLDSSLSAPTTDGPPAPVSAENSDFAGSSL